MKIYLIPPSESKQLGGDPLGSLVENIFEYSVPVDIAQSATEKDLKCKGVRYAQAMELNNSIYTSPVMPAIQRYSGVMYKVFGYMSMTRKQQVFIENHVYILSGLRGILKPTDQISNYKLPVTTQLAKHRKPQVTQYIIDLSPTEIINLLPGAYMKMVDWKVIELAGISVTVPNFRKPDGSIYTHGIKKVRGEWLRREFDIHISGLDLKNVYI